MFEQAHHWYYWAAAAPFVAPFAFFALAAGLCAAGRWRTRRRRAAWRALGRALLSVSRGADSQARFNQICNEGRHLRAATMRDRKGPVRVRAASPAE